MVAVLGMLNGTLNPEGQVILQRAPLLYLEPNGYSSLTSLTPMPNSEDYLQNRKEVYLYFVCWSSNESSTYAIYIACALKVSLN